MRLSEREVNNIVEALQSFVSDTKVELRLYGSRVDDNTKGGDIDLLLLVDSEEIAARLIYRKPEILVAVKKLLGERQLDLKVATVVGLHQDPFLKVIYPKSILLHKF